MGLMQNSDSLIMLFLKAHSNTRCSLKQHFTARGLHHPVGLGKRRSCQSSGTKWKWQSRIPAICWRREEALPCPDCPICCTVLVVKYRDRSPDMPSQQNFPSFDLKSLSNMYQPKSAQLAPLQKLDASKHHAWHEWEWEEKPWHPWAGEVEPQGKSSRQALERLKPVVQTSYYGIIILSRQLGGCGPAERMGVGKSI